MNIIHAIIGCYRHHVTMVDISDSGFSTLIDLECATCKKKRTFFGSSTVWRDSNTGRRAGTMMESLLSDTVALEKFRRETSAR
jgi:hypothetical protein